MKLFDFLALVLYAFLLSVIVFLLFQVFFPPIVVVEQPVVSWPWSITSYNHWPTWYGSGGLGGYSGGIRRHGGYGHGGYGHGGFPSRPWGGASRMANEGAPTPSAPTPSAPTPTPSAPSTATSAPSK